MAKEIIELTCIGCPLGCSLKVEKQDAEILSVEGNTCPRGDAYARKEVTNPTRIVTSSVKVVGGEVETVSCKTASDIPKNLIFSVIEVLRGQTVTAPVRIGDVLVKNVCGTGVDIVATKEVQSA